MSLAARRNASPRGAAPRNAAHHYATRYNATRRIVPQGGSLLRAASHRNDHLTDLPGRTGTPRARWKGAAVPAANAAAPPISLT